MRTSVNPGSWLVLEGSFELAASLAEMDQGAPYSMMAERRALVVDRESGRIVTLADLFRSLLEDPTETVTGPVRVTIEAA